MTIKNNQTQNHSVCIFPKGNAVATIHALIENTDMTRVFDDSDHVDTVFKSICKLSDYFEQKTSTTEIKIEQIDVIGTLNATLADIENNKNYTKQIGTIKRLLHILDVAGAVNPILIRVTPVIDVTNNEIGGFLCEKSDIDKVDAMPQMKNSQFNIM